MVKRASGAGPAAFSITYEGENPVVVAQVANELASRFIEWNLQTRQQLAVSTTEFLGDQLHDVKRNLEHQEGQVRAFKMQHLGEMPEHVPANLGNVAQLRAHQTNVNDQLNRLEQERIEMQRLPDSAARYGRLAPMTPTSERARLQEEKMRLEGQLFELRKRYTSAHPELTQAQTRLERVNQQVRSLPRLDAEASKLVGHKTPPTRGAGVICRRRKMPRVGA